MSDWSYEVTASLNQSEYIRFQYWWSLRRYKYFVPILAAAGAAYPLYYLFSTSPEELRNTNWLPFLIPWLFLGFLIVIIYSSSKKQFKGVWSKNNPTTYRISPSGIETESKGGSCRVDWEEVKSVHEAGDLIVIARTGFLVFLIPKRALGDETELRELVTRLRAAVAG